MSYNKEQILKIYESEKNKTYVAKEYAKLNNIEYTENLRKRVGEVINSSVSSDENNSSTTESNQYKDNTILMPSAWSAEKNRFFSIEEYCDTFGLDKKTVKSSKLVSHNASHMVYNIVFFNEEEDIIRDIDRNFESIITKYIKPIILSNKIVTKKEEFFDRIVYTDCHLGMDVNGKDGDPLYVGKWDKEEVLNRLSKMVEHVKKHKVSNTLIIDDLGDFMDGLGGQTTRKGHELPQNMNDKEAFDLALEFKVSLVDSLIGSFDKIICNNITNDNHSGVFSYFVVSAVKQILEQRYKDKVEVNNIKKFISHYSFGKHTFLLSHGKDIGEQKFGFKPKLDAVQAEKIDQYCKENKLYNGNYIEFGKGDSHQAIYDETTSNDFSYYNYPAFSPPSNWVKTNFKLSKSGFNFFNINKEENIKISIPFWF